MSIVTSAIPTALTVHSAEFNETTGIVDSRALFRICGLVVVAQRFCLALVTQHASGVTGVGLSRTVSHEERRSARAEQTYANDPTVGGEDGADGRASGRFVEEVRV